MKAFVVVATVLCAALLQQVYAAPPELMAKCMQESGATKEDMMAFAEKGEGSDAFKCHMKCIMLGFGGMTEDGKLVLEPMLANKPESIHGVLKECVNIEQGGDLCDLAYRHNVCIREKNPEFYKNMMKMSNSR